MALPLHKVYRNVETRQRLLGLEVVDGAALTAIFALASIFNRRGVFWNLALVFALYIALRIFKRGKPQGYVTALVRFYARRPSYSAGASDLQIQARPFRPRSLTTQTKEKKHV